MIVCLGWGFLIWRPGDLPVGDWRDDGPELKVEFVRESTDHRLTLVLDPDADDPVVSVNWWKSRKRVIIGRGDRAYAACFIPSMS